MFLLIIITANINNRSKQIVGNSLLLALGNCKCTGGNSWTEIVALGKKGQVKYKSVS